MKKALIIAALLLTLTIFPVFASASAENDVSPAIAVLRHQTVMRRSAVLGSGASFTKSEYENVVGKGIQYVTVTSLPDNAVLTLGGIKVANGQTVSSSSLDLLELSSPKDGKTASFEFRPSSEGWENVDIRCVVDFCESTNTPPVLNNGNLECRKNVRSVFDINVFEPDGDEVGIVIDEYPVSGRIDASDGKIVYFPVEGFTGNDKFVLHAVDEYGNESAKATFNVKVSDSSLVFADMTSSPAHADAIKLAENNVVSYIKRGGSYYFEPEKEVSRIDFLVMLMTGCGIAPAEDDVTVFADASSLSSAKRSYLAEADEKGIIEKRSEFRPSDTVTRLDAAMWVTAIIGESENLSAFSDVSSLSSAEAAAASTVVQKGIFNAENGNFRPDDPLDREETAYIISRLMDAVN